MISDSDTPLSTHVHVYMYVCATPRVDLKPLLQNSVVPFALMATESAVFNEPVFHPPRLWGIDFHFNTFNKLYIADILTLKPYSTYPGMYHVLIILLVKTGMQLDRNQCFRHGPIYIYMSMALGVCVYRIKFKMNHSTS